MPSNDKVADFIKATFRSVWALELLCTLRQERERSFTHDELVAALRASDVVVGQSIAGLVAAGLVLTDDEGRARYGPATEATDALAGAAEERYAKSPNAVRRMIVSGANPGLTAFADAFKLRKD